MQVAIRCSDLRKRYNARPPVEAVRGIDLVVEVGECFGVLGPNGAGKTTTIEILEGLLPATTGEVDILGLRWDRSANQIREQIGITLQDTQFAERLSVMETVTLFRSFYRQGLDPAEAVARLSLEDKARARIDQLSGGQKQRLAVATGLVGDPKLLFLDEPTTGLDPQSRRQLWDVIGDFRRTGRTVMLTTHYLEEAERLCDRVAIIDRGKIIALGTPADLIAGIGADHIIEFSLDGKGVPHALSQEWDQHPDVTSINCDNGSYRMSVTQLHTVLPSLLASLDRQSLHLASLRTRHAGLEDVFVELTGRQLEPTEEPQ